MNFIKEISILLVEFMKGSMYNSDRFPAIALNFRDILCNSTK